MPFYYIFRVLLALLISSVLFNKYELERYIIIIIIIIIITIIIRQLEKRTNKDFKTILSHKAQSFAIFLKTLHRRLIAYGHQPRANFQKTFLASPFAISITHFQRVKTY